MKRAVLLSAGVLCLLSFAAEASFAQGFYPPRRARWGEELDPELFEFYAPDGRQGNNALRDLEGGGGRYTRAWPREGEVIYYPAYPNTQRGWQQYTIIHAGAPFPRQQVVMPSKGNRYQSRTMINRVQRPNYIRRYSSR